MLEMHGVYFLVNMPSLENQMVWFAKSDCLVLADLAYISPILFDCDPLVMCIT
jgi:hypothetical protein